MTAPWRTALPFVALGAACVVGGGLTSAATAPMASMHSAWAVAYLVLVAGAAQIALGLGQAFLAPAPPGGRRLGIELAAWNGGNAAVLTGVLAGVTPLADAGGAALVLTLALVAASVRGGGPELWRTRRVFLLLVAVLLVSIPVGLVLARLE
ncbi:hypothetical protein ORV05_20850 [Amycolatopsis cynarae]|uniref:Uncharacterized protein n=1 Tax=Amycolatopsis cynarae TaxID=2995223 RepID=A0ABY7AWR3_9PSEU|nr:hypothetical protein [Amycolatopsis sp. HUAS 11-8]WAL63463.1 hypothetical protein ORV05_20850 [Amycolatopsis sp. HUAS 11-8]